MESRPWFVGRKPVRELAAILLCGWLLAASAGCAAPPRGSQAANRQASMNWFLDRLAHMEARRPAELGRAVRILEHYAAGDPQGADRVARHILEWN